jgi:lipoate-protein ligase A
MQIIYSTSTSAQFNLASEEYLFFESHKNILFLYVNEPTVVVGSNQAIQNEVDLDYCNENGIQLVRRMSGGGTVYHDFGNLNYCFISNKKGVKTSLNSDFLLPIVEVLKRLGISVEIGKRKDLWLTGGYKISGTASHIGKIRELHHGTLLYDTDLKKLQNAISPRKRTTTIKAIPSVSSPVSNIRDYLQEQNLPAKSTNEFVNSFLEAMLNLYNLDTISYLSTIDFDKIQKIQQNKYDLSEWVFRK